MLRKSRGRKVSIPHAVHHSLTSVCWNPKDTVLVPANRREGVVYSIPCAQCPCTYVGQTGRSLDVRLREHRRALRNGDFASSALAEHVFSCDHQVDLSKPTMIDAHPHTQTCAC